MLLRASEATIRSLTTVAVNDAILLSLTDELKYNDIINIQKNEEGEIIAMSADTLKVNKITRDTAYISMKCLNESISKGVDLPVGAFSGLEILAGFGPKVNFQLITVSNIDCKFISKFQSQGINQTKHSLYLQLVSNISIIMPDETTSFSSVNEVFICENIIVGKIPNTFLQTADFSDGLDLIPN